MILLFSQGSLQSHYVAQAGFVLTVVLSAKNDNDHTQFKLHFEGDRELVRVVMWLAVKMRCM